MEVFLIDEAGFVMSASVLKFLDGVRTIAEPEQAEIEITGLDFLQVGAADGFRACSGILFPYPAGHAIGVKSRLHGASFIGEFLHFAADEERERLIGGHRG